MGLSWRSTPVLRTAASGIRVQRAICTVAQVSATTGRLRWISPKDGMDIKTKDELMVQNILSQRWRPQNEGVYKMLHVSLFTLRDLSVTLDYTPQTRPIFQILRSKPPSRRHDQNKSVVRTSLLQQSSSTQSNAAENHQHSCHCRAGVQSRCRACGGASRRTRRARARARRARSSGARRQTEDRSSTGVNTALSSGERTDLRAEARCCAAGGGGRLGREGSGFG